MRLIDAHSLIMPIALYMTENAYLNDTALDVLKMVAKWVETEPTIEAEPVRHGRWEAYPDDAHMKCSACGMEYLKENMPKVVGYCPNPNCGAKMDGGAEDGTDA